MVLRVSVLLLCLAVLSAGSVSCYDYCQADQPSVDVYSKFATQFPELQLQALNLVTRHGDRSPYILLPKFLEYAYDCTENFDYADNSGGKKPAPVQRVVLDDDDACNPFARYASYAGSCEVGQLTSTGTSQLHSNGQMLRKVYVDTAGFLPANFSSEFAYLRSTDVWRTRMSLTALMQGLYSENHRDSVPEYHTIDLSADVLTPNKAQCPKYADLDKETFQSAGWLHYLETQAPVTEELSDVLGFDVSDLNSLLEYGDLMHTAVCTGQPLPCNPENATSCVSQELAEKVFEVGDYYYQYLYSEYKQKEHAQLGIGTLVRQLRDNFVNVTNKFNYYSGHDTTIAPLLGALNLTGERWPPYASQIVMELWSPVKQQKVSAADKTKSVVRVLYNGQPMKLDCYDSSIRGCSLKAFSDYVDTISVPNLYKACHAK
jgi:hypothetical protein